MPSSVFEFVSAKNQVVTPKHRAGQITAPNKNTRNRKEMGPLRSVWAPKAYISWIFNVHILIFRWPKRPKPLIFMVWGANDLYDFPKATCKCANSTPKYLCIDSASFVPYQIHQQALNCPLEMLSKWLSCCGMLLALLLLLRRLLPVLCSVRWWSWCWCWWWGTIELTFFVPRCRFNLRVQGYKGSRTVSMFCGEKSRKSYSKRYDEMIWIIPWCDKRNSINMSWI